VSRKKISPLGDLVFAYRVRKRIDRYMKTISCDVYAIFFQVAKGRLANRDTWWFINQIRKEDAFMIITLNIGTACNRQSRIRNINIRPDTGTATRFERIKTMGNW
jgi:hypothetical protein